MAQILTKGFALEILRIGESGAVPAGPMQSRQPLAGLSEVGSATDGCRIVQRVTARPTCSSRRAQLARADKSVGAGRQECLRHVRWEVTGRNVAAATRTMKTVPFAK